MTADNLQISTKDASRWLLTPSWVGTITAATVALYPLKYGEKGIQQLQVSFTEQWEYIQDLFPFKLVSALLGFFLGFGLMKVLLWIRWELVRFLLSSTIWMTKPKSFRTKLWAMSLNLLEGKGPHGNFTFQKYLPHQPLPSLNQILDRYLTVVKNLLSEEDFHKTKLLTEEFRKNEGPKLHSILTKKAATKTSWIADIWLQVAYLSGREPLPLNSNFYVANRLRPDRPVSQLARTAASIYAGIQFENLVRTGRLSTVMLNNLVPLCMAGYKNIFNTVRIPGEPIDILKNFPNLPNQYVVVIRKGHYFKMPVYAPEKTGGSNCLTMVEIQQQLQYIVDVTDEMEFGTSVAALTTQDRSAWAKHRELLKAKPCNRDILDDIERAMFMVSLDTFTPQSTNQFLKYCLSGDGSNRWFDKCYTLGVCSDGSMAVNVEHTGIDAYVYVTLTEFSFMTENHAFENGDLNRAKWPHPRRLPPPKQMKWEIQDMDGIILQALQNYKQTVDLMDFEMIKAPYSKGLMKKKKISPDGYIQMALQLAYYRLHKTTPKTYEPATSRLFALGRTETVHPASPSSISWVKSMDDPSILNKTKIELLKESVKYQSKFRLDSTAGYGCDRPLLGLYCCARELGIMPKIFMDPTFRMPFKLSTSQTPTNINSFNLQCVDYETCGGGFGPTAADGYGICYPVISDDILTFHMSCWKSSGLSTKALGNAITQALVDMKKLWD